MCRSRNCSLVGNGVVTIMVKKLTRKKRRGAAIVEFALVLPLLLMLTLGAIRYGHLFLKAQQITNAARHGARMSIRPDGPTTSAEVRTVVLALMTAAGMDGDFEVTLSPEAVTTVGAAITVQITVPSASIAVVQVPLFTNLEPAGWQLGAAVTMAKEGF